MNPQLQALLEQAESRYLQPEEIDLVRRYTASLTLRLETYETLREQEEEIFQPIADKLVAALPAVEQTTLERALKHWLLILRYCATAMLLNDPEFMQQRLLDWLKGLVETHQMQSVETAVYKLLVSRLKEVVSSQQLALLQPFLVQAKSTLLQSHDE